MTYAEALSWLYSTQLFGIKPGLDPMRRLLAELQVDVSASPEKKIIHVAGTNGKGSTCAFLDSICRAAGHRTALFTSPHLVSFRERLRLNAEMIPPEEAAWRLTRLRELVRDWTPHPTFFELTTALAFWWFQDQQAQVWVIETGMGGRLDATNVVTPTVSVITPIALDHAQWLGATLDLIAGEKAGIIKPQCPVISAMQPALAAPVIAQQALEKNAALTVVDYPLSGWSLGLRGPHQEENAALAVQALAAAQLLPTKDALRRGLAETRWPGRFQWLDAEGRIILDGAHNPHGTTSLLTAWQQAFGVEKAIILYGAVQGKNVDQSLQALEKIAAQWIFTPLPSPRTHQPQELQNLLPADSAVPVHTNTDVTSALALAQKLATENNHRLLICGSLYLVGEALTLLDPTFAPLSFEVSLQ